MTFTMEATPRHPPSALWHSIGGIGRAMRIGAVTPPQCRRSAVPRRPAFGKIPFVAGELEARESERERGWPQWGAAIRAALDSRNLTINSAATSLGLRNATLKRWIAGEVPPQLSRLADIAELTGLSSAIQLELGEVLPPEFRPEAHAIQVADELRRAFGQVTEVVSHAAELAFSDAGARLAGVLLATDAPLQVSLRRAHRGIRYPVHLCTYVGVECLDRDTWDENQLRQQVTGIVGQSARALGARWREQEAHDWPPPRPGLILSVPQYERPRPPSSGAAQAVPNLLMLGCPYAHAEYIGAILADALGYGYIDLRYSVPLPLDRSPSDPIVVGSRIDFASDIAGNERATRHHVWSLADHRVLPAVLPALQGSAIGCAIYVRSEDGLLARGSEVWNVALDELLKLRAMLDDLVVSADWPVLTLVMPDELLKTRAGDIDRDLLADVSMLAAADIWVRLRQSQLVPDRPGGRLAAMFDARGRLVGDPRLPMVRTEANMPSKRRKQ